MQLRGTVVGKDLQSKVTVTLPAPALDAVTITVKSSDPRRLLVGQGNESVQVTIQRAERESAVPVSALVDTGQVEVTASAGEYGTATAKVTLLPSGFIFRTKEVRGSAFSRTDVSVIPAAIDSGNGNPVLEQTLRRGAEPVQIQITTSNP